MSFMDDLRTKVKEAPMGSKERDLFKFILGDLQNLPGSGKAKVADPEDHICVKYVEGFVKTNKVTLNILNSKNGMEENIAKIEHENLCLSEFLPKQLNIDEIREHLKDIDVKSSPKMGPAIGMAMGHLKKQGLALNVKGNLVTQIVKEMRGE